MQGRKLALAERIELQALLQGFIMMAGLTGPHIVAVLGYSLTEDWLLLLLQADCSPPLTVF